MITKVSDGPSLAGSPNPLSWWRVGVAALLVFSLIGCVLLTLLAVSESNEPCPNENFDVSQTDLLDHRTFPPKSVCRYTYVSGTNGAAIAPPDVVTYDSAPLVILTVITIVISCVYGWWFVRGIRRHPW